MEKPTWPTGGEQRLSPPFKRQSLLEVSEIDRGNTSNVSKPRLPSVHLSPLRWGKTVRPRTVCPRSRPVLSSNNLKQTWPWGSEGRMKGVTTGRSLVRGTASRATTRQWQQRVDTGCQLQMTQQRGYFGHGSDLSHSQLSCLEAGGAVHATQSRDRF